MELLELSDLAGNPTSITDGGCAMGTAMCLTLANFQAAFAVGDLDHGDAQKAPGQINSIGEKALGVTCHFTIHKDLVNLVDVMVKEPGSVHILLNNAGFGGGGRDNPFKISVEDFAWRIQPNVFSAWKFFHLCVPH